MVVGKKTKDAFEGLEDHNASEVVLFYIETLYSVNTLLHVVIIRSNWTSRYHQALFPVWSNTLEDHRASGSKEKACFQVPQSLQHSQPSRQVGICVCTAAAFSIFLCIADHFSLSQYKRITVKKPPGSAASAHSGRQVIKPLDDHGLTDPPDIRSHSRTGQAGVDSGCSHH